MILPKSCKKLGKNLVKHLGKISTLHDLAKILQETWQDLCKMSWQFLVLHYLAKILHETWQHDLILPRRLTICLQDHVRSCKIMQVIFARAAIVLAKYKFKEADI